MANITPTPATEIKVGDQVAERDGALLRVTSAERVGRFVHLELESMGASRTVTARVRTTTRVNLFAGAGS